MTLSVIALILLGMGAVVAASCLLHGNGRDDEEEYTGGEGGNNG